MNYFDIDIDDEKNNLRTNGIREINKANATVKLLVVPTNEELEIAEQCFALLR